MSCVIIRKLGPGEKGSGSLQSRPATMLHHENDALESSRFFGGPTIVLQCSGHVRNHFHPLPTKLIFAYFDSGSYALGFVDWFLEV